jgi:hypothetical protein
MPHVTPLHADDPRLVGPYRLTGRIAGMPGAGPVYHARTAGGGEVTITLVGGDWTGDSAARDRFTAEAFAARRVAPFCAARILGSGFDGEDAFLVSDYVAGPSLQELVTEDGPWEGLDLEALAIGMATGLAAVHQAGLVHGEFGPEHVVLGADGPRVIEFGITPPYGAATPAADLRAWALTVLYAAVGGPAGPADLQLVPDLLRTLAQECMAAGPGDRPTARSLVVQLLGDSDPPAGVFGEGTRRAARAAVRPAPAAAAGPPPPPSRNASTAPRRPVTIWWAGGIVAGILAIAVAIRATQNQGSPQPSKPAATRQSTPGPAHHGRSPGPTPPPAVPSSLAGTWSGKVTQTPVAGTSTGTFIVSVQLSLTAGTSGGTIHYSNSGSFSCAGALTLLSDLAGALTMDQAISQGPCGHGVVTLSPGASSATLDFRFTGKGAPPATGTLSRL